MAICVYCDKPCLKNQKVTTYDEHRICVEQKEQRYKDRLCVRCGKDDDNNRVKYESCSLNPNAERIGYDGPSV